MNPELTSFFVCHKCWNENLECTDCHGITNNMPNKPLAERVPEDRISITDEKNLVELYHRYTIHVSGNGQMSAVFAGTTSNA